MGYLLCFFLFIACGFGLFKGFLTLRFLASVVSFAFGFSWFLLDSVVCLLLLFAVLYYCLLLLCFCGRCCMKAKRN